MESKFLSTSSDFENDPLSDVLSFLKPRSYMAGGIDAGPVWAIAFKQDQFFRCFALVSGQCWLRVDGVAGLTRLEAGDFVVLPHGRPFSMMSDPGVKSVDIESVVMSPLNGRIYSYKGGGACLVLSALFTFAGDHAALSLSVLPPIVHIRKDSDRAAMRWYLERMMTVLQEPLAGGVRLGQHLAQMILIDVLRLHVADEVSGRVGWLFALADRQIGKAITMMHSRPGYRWTLRELAEGTGMSRSSFAFRFKEKVGISSMEYLTRWRMILAAERLVHSRDSVLTIALSLGYESESAFGFAFKRGMGCPPRQYCRTRALSSNDVLLQSLP